MYCRSCGEELVDGIDSCPFCGEPADVPKRKKIASSSYSNSYISRPSQNFNGLNSVCSLILLILIPLGLYFGIEAINDNSKPRKRSSSSSYSSTSSSSLSSPDFSSTSSSLSSYSSYYSKQNYEQIYNEYSQKLINAGPTSSISEMADILNDGITKMAEYMYTAKGIDGQYETYEQWGMKLYNVYLENCR